MNHRLIAPIIFALASTACGKFAAPKADPARRHAISKLFWLGETMASVTRTQAIEGIKAEARANGKTFMTALAEALADPVRFKALVGDLPSYMTEGKSADAIESNRKYVVRVLANIAAKYSTEKLPSGQVDVVNERHVDDVVVETMLAKESIEARAGKGAFVVVLIAMYGHDLSKGVPEAYKSFNAMMKEFAAQVWSVENPVDLTPEELKTKIEALAENATQKYLNSPEAKALSLTESQLRLIWERALGEFRIDMRDGPGGAEALYNEYLSQWIQQHGTEEQKAKIPVEPSIDYKFHGTTMVHQIPGMEQTAKIAAEAVDESVAGRPEIAKLATEVTVTQHGHNNEQMSRDSYFTSTAERLDLRGLSAEEYFPTLKKLFGEDADRLRATSQAATAVDRYNQAIGNGSTPGATDALLKGLFEKLPADAAEKLKAVQEKENAKGVTWGGDILKYFGFLLAPSNPTLKAALESRGGFINATYGTITQLIGNMSAAGTGTPSATEIDRYHRALFQMYMLKSIKISGNTATVELGGASIPLELDPRASDTSVPADQRKALQALELRRIFATILAIPGVYEKFKGSLANDKYYEHTGIPESVFREFFDRAQKPIPVISADASPAEIASTMKATLEAFSEGVLPKGAHQLSALEQEQVRETAKAAIEATMGTEVKGKAPAAAGQVFDIPVTATKELATDLLRERQEIGRRVLTNDAATRLEIVPDTTVLEKSFCAVAFELMDLHTKIKAWQGIVGEQLIRDFEAHVKEASARESEKRAHEKEREAAKGALETAGETERAVLEEKIRTLAEKIATAQRAVEVSTERAREVAREAEKRARR